MDNVNWDAFLRGWKEQSSTSSSSSESNLLTPDSIKSLGPLLSNSSSGQSTESLMELLIESEGFGRFSLRSSSEDEGDPTDS